MLASQSSPAGEAQNRHAHYSIDDLGLSVGEIAPPDNYGAWAKPVGAATLSWVGESNFSDLSTIHCAYGMPNTVWFLPGRSRLGAEKGLRRQMNLAQGPQVTADGDSAPAPRNWTVAKILVVDDDPVMQITIRLLLERAGHSVVVAADGYKGLAALDTADFNLLMLDIFMPAMDGLETMRLVHQRQPGLPIIAMSGRPITPDPSAEPDFLAMATRLGAVRSLPKPFQPAALLAMVADCLGTAKYHEAGS